MLKSFNEIGTAITFPPISEQPRLAYVSNNRQLFYGNFSQLNIPERDNEKILPSNNWFKRIAEFIPEMMFGESPVLTINGGTESMNKITNEMFSYLVEHLLFINIDVLRFGTGTLLILPGQDIPNLFSSVQPDNCFVVTDPQGRQIGDIIAYPVRGQETRPFVQHIDAADDNRLIVHKFNYRDGTYIYEEYAYRQSAIGELITTETRPIQAGSQYVQRIHNGYVERFSGQSAYDFIKGNVTEIVKRYQELSGTLSRNSRPHLYGPVNAIQTDANGRRTINADGHYFPLQQGDIAPGYLQWDTDLEAVTKNINFQQEEIFLQTGLSRLIFEQSRDSVQNLSGSALRRLLIPLKSKLNMMRRLNERLIRNALCIGAAESPAGTFVLDKDNIEIEWEFDNLFVDDNDQLLQQDANERSRENVQPNE